MRHIRKLDFDLVLSTLICATSLASRAESGILVVHVKDVQEHPIAGLQIGVKGDSGFATTGRPTPTLVIPTGARSVSDGVAEEPAFFCSATAHASLSS